jgi:hypothetical protein
MSLVRIGAVVIEAVLGCVCSVRQDGDRAAVTGEKAERNQTLRRCLRVRRRPSCSP